MAIYQARVVIEAIETGTYQRNDGTEVDWGRQIIDACVAETWLLQMPLKCQQLLICSTAGD